MTDSGNIDGNPITESLKSLSAGSFSALDLLSGRTVPEKLTELSLLGVPAGPSKIMAGLKQLSGALHGLDVSEVRVVVFGGGTGLSTIVGGDSRSMSWIADPFNGLKAIFPQTSAIVCITDDGGSTGELLKDLPLIGLGDLRHVLLSSIQAVRLRQRYYLDESQARHIAVSLFELFNYRYKCRPTGFDDLLSQGRLDLDSLPEAMAQGIFVLLQGLFADSRLIPILARPHCLGNLLITSAIYSCYKGPGIAPSPEAIRDGLRILSDLLCIAPDSVLPCTTTPSMLKMSYANGVVVSGEYKSGLARRGYPVDQVFVDFLKHPAHVLPEVLGAIRQADIIIFAPGSLYTSIVPVMQVPGLAQAVRDNNSALKVLVANLWVQAGETDLAMDDPHRRFYVSDLLKAYQRNIPGGVDGLFKYIMLMGLRDIPGSILQNYAVEGKMPIYLDRGRVWRMGFSPLEAGVFSVESLADQRLKHDPAALALTVKTMWAARAQIDDDGHRPESAEQLPVEGANFAFRAGTEFACERYAGINARLADLKVAEHERIADILWRHADIPVAHIAFMRGLRFVDRNAWCRSQEWDNIYSFFNPEDGFLNIRQDMLNGEHFEVAFLVALGQSLLGNYFTEKHIAPLIIDGENMGKIYRIYLRPEEERDCLFTDQQLRQYLMLARMCPSGREDVFTRVLNGDEGFTPPGLLFGLTYAWYIDNRFVSHIEYKMAVARAEVSDLVPEQLKTLNRRRALVDFFRTVVFGQ